MSASEQVRVARGLLSGCLWDEEPWESDDLVELMEKVYATLGGDLSAPPAASLSPLDEQGSAS